MHPCIHNPMHYPIRKNYLLASSSGSEVNISSVEANDITGGVGHGWGTVLGLSGGFTGCDIIKTARDGDGAGNGHSDERDESDEGELHICGLSLVVLNE